MEFLRLSKDTLINWLILPQVELVSNSEDNAEVAMAKVRERCQREEEAKKQEEEAKAEWWRQKEVRKAAEAQKTEITHQWEEAERQRVIDEAWEQMEREQQEEMQMWARAITVTQGSGTPGPSTAVVVPIARACERCTLLLKEPEGCVVREKGKVWACLLCQKVRKACVWPLGLAEVTVVMGSGNEVSGKPAPRRMRKRAERAVTNTSPRGGEKRKKAHMMMEEGEDDEDAKEVFRVPRALAQVAERMVATEAHDEERLTLEWETVEIWRAHLAMVRRAVDCEEERLEMDRVQLSIAQQQMEDLWKMGTLMRSPFVHLSKGKERAVETEVEVEERGEEVDDKDEDAQGEEE
ncbi:hypothetical protein SCLCIDRAFT_27829 [Scleroderma citrinum Foug A]|uniref:Uncharacterized protein n=1 Tax=Scleroderma citrinum Foug A TaxID=1036808 RepID=A0A0C3DR42_9AGAM|nr:hypothetical protein SCLCIDRAFT_27829 [Scleroderma citrinum Foug A]